MRDDPERAGELSRRVNEKYAVRRLYEEFYGLYRKSLDAAPQGGLAIELGSGAGFAQQLLPELVTTDVIAYDCLDLVADGTCMPFTDGSVRFVCMCNVLHHVPDAEALFRELNRCLMDGGRVLIVDEHVGWISRWVFRYIHHEPFHPEAKEWAFASTGPLTGANGALAWMIFQRDVERFQQLFPRLALARYRPHTPLRYWLAGGLKPWSLIPPPLWPLATALDKFLLRCSPQFGSFVEIELVKRAAD